MCDSCTRVRDRINPHAQRHARQEANQHPHLDGYTHILPNRFLHSLPYSHAFQHLDRDPNLHIYAPPDSYQYALTHTNPAHFHASAKPDHQGL